MRAVIQRVNRTAVRVDSEMVGEITRPGLIVLAGATYDDGPTQMATVTRKVTDLRLLEDEFSVTDARAPVLVISQFTLYADAHKDRRPTWNKAIPGEVAGLLVGTVAEDLHGRGLGIITGRFDANMKIDMEADGLVTILIEAEQAGGTEDAVEGNTKMTGCSRAVMVAMMLRWAVFGYVSVSWALGSPWLVGTVLQGDGLGLAQGRPTWSVVVVLVSGLVKLGFVVFGSAFLCPDVIGVPRWMRLAFGWVSGTLLITYGMVDSAPAISTIMSREPLSRYGQWCPILWMPHFWMDGILVPAATIVYFHWSRSSNVGPRRV